MSQNNGMICNFKDINTKIAKLLELIGSDVIPLTMVEITYSELKNLRDNSQLIPGCWYRITDYETTTSENNTQSAGHLFDVIVLALTNDTLSEEAWACHSERDTTPLQGIVASLSASDYSGSVKFVREPSEDGRYNEEFYYSFYSDEAGFVVYTKSLEEEPTVSTIFVFLNSRGEPTTINDEDFTVVSVSEFASQVGASFEITDLIQGYFALSNLSAWKLWYCLDNDTNRFAWAKSDTDLTITIKQSGPNGLRDPEHDLPELGLYAWRFSDRETYYSYTFEELPNVGDYTVLEISNGEALIITSVTAESIQCSNDSLYSRDSSLDKNGYYGWRSIEIKSNPNIIYTKTELPVVGDEIQIVSYPDRIITDISWNGKGVIYRMIDEFGNDCPYDFKNIQHILPINDGGFVDQSGTDKPCYTFDGLSRDYSITGEASNNVIGSRYEFGYYYIPIVRMGSGNGNRIGVNCNRIYLGAMDGANVCQYVTNVDYQTASKDTYRMYEWFGIARNGSVVQTNIFGTAT